MRRQQGGLLRKSRTHTGGRESEAHVLLDETRAQGTQPRRPLTGPGRPHLSADLDTTLFIPKTLTLSQHGPPGATKDAVQTAGETLAPAPAGLPGRPAAAPRPHPAPGAPSERTTAAEPSIKDLFKLNNEHKPSFKFHFYSK